MGFSRGVSEPKAAASHTRLGTCEVSVRISCICFKASGGAAHTIARRPLNNLHISSTEAFALVRVSDGLRARWCFFPQGQELLANWVQFWGATRRVRRGTQLRASRKWYGREA